MLKPADNLVNHIQFDGALAQLIAAATVGPE
jgi:hypothetical protein